LLSAFLYSSHSTSIAEILKHLIDNGENPWKEIGLMLDKVSFHEQELVY
jgi:hypothetical protein